MKVFESGMRNEAYWNSLFDIPTIIDWLDLKSITAPIAEVGYGYGTFTVPIAKQTPQTIYAIDIESSMIETASRNVGHVSVTNVAGSVGLVLLFNILHSSERVQMLREASRILKNLVESPSSTAGGTSPPRGDQA